MPWNSTASAERLDATSFRSDPRIRLPERRSTRMLTVIEALLAAAVLTLPFFLGSLDSGAGRATICLMMVGLLLFMLARPILSNFWPSVMPILLTAALADLWIMLFPLLAPEARLAPDLAASNMLGFHAGVMAFICGALVGHRRGATLILVDALLVGLAIAFAVSLAGSFGWIEGLPPLKRFGRLVGLADNANIQAVAAVVASLLAVGRLLAHVRHRKPADAWAWHAPALYAGSLIIAVAVLLLTGSRFPLVTGLMLMAILLVRGLHGAASRQRFMQLMGAIVVVGSFLLWGMSDLVLQRMGQVDAASAIRTDMWSRYLGAAWRSPWFGYGPGGFPTLNAQLLSTPRVAEAAWTVNSPHNIVLQLLLKGGLPYFLLLLAGAVLWARPVVDYFRSGRRSTEAWAIALVIACILANAMIDICLDVPATTCLALFLAGLLWGDAIAAKVVHVIEPRRAPGGHHRDEGI